MRLMICLSNRNRMYRRIFVDEARDEVVAGNATMAVVYSGEAYLGNQYNDESRYVIPKEGSNVLAGFLVCDETV